MNDTAAAPADTGDFDNTGSVSTEASFPKVIERAEESGITHYAPKAHEALDPSKRV